MSSLLSGRENQLEHVLLSSRSSTELFWGTSHGRGSLLLGRARTEYAVLSFRKKCRTKDSDDVSGRKHARLVDRCARVPQCSESSLAYSCQLKLVSFSGHPCFGVLAKSIWRVYECTHGPQATWFAFRDKPYCVGITQQLGNLVEKNQYIKHHFFSFLRHPTHPKKLLISPPRRVNERDERKGKKRFQLVV
jgi:hypothetical protein